MLLSVFCRSLLSFFFLSSGQYVFVEAKDSYEGNWAELALSPITGSKCLNFWYHMYGSGVGELNVYLDYSKIFSKYGSQGGGWKFAQLSIDGFYSEVCVSVFTLSSVCSFTRSIICSSIT